MKGTSRLSFAAALFILAVPSGSGSSLPCPGKVPLAGRRADYLITKIIGWIVIILIVVWVLSNPAAAGSTVHGWITGIISFFQHLAGG